MHLEASAFSTPSQGSTYQACKATVAYICSWKYMAAPSNFRTRTSAPIHGLTQFADRSTPGTTFTSFVTNTQTTTFLSSYPVTQTSTQIQTLTTSYAITTTAPGKY